MAQYKDGTYIVKDGKIYEVQIDIPRMMGAEVIHVALKDFKKQTNADRIRSMTDEELAHWMYKHMSCRDCPCMPCVRYENIDEEGNIKCTPCELILLEWLRKKAEDEHTE